MNERSKKLRRDTIALSSAHGGYHYGGCFSCVEILITLFDRVMADPIGNPMPSPNGDRFILSKGHACWPYYVLLRERGKGPRLEGHPYRDPANGVHCTTGSEGHGLPTGMGMAMAKKLRGLDGKVYVLMGDGECQEGTTWESILIASRHRLGNLVAIVDWNRIQGSDFVKNILPLEALAEAAEGALWDVVRVDGHNCEAVEAAVTKSQKRPRMVIAETVKGKGVSFMEGRPEWHARWLDDEHKEMALRELA